jgi:hypothetical protein
MFETPDAAQEAHRRAMDWIKDNLSDFVEGQPEVIKGAGCCERSGSSRNGRLSNLLVLPLDEMLGADAELCPSRRCSGG